MTDAACEGTWREQNDAHNKAIREQAHDAFAEPCDIETSQGLIDALSILHAIATCRGGARVHVPFTVADQIAAAEALARVCLSVEEHPLLRANGILFPAHPRRDR